MGPPNTRAEEPPASQSRPNQAIRMRAEGASISEISDNLGISERGVRDILESPLAQERLKKINKSLSKQQADSYDEDDGVNALLKSAAPKAVRTLIQLLDSPNPAQQRQSAQEILDRAGYSKTEHQEVEHIIQIPEAQAQTLAQTAEVVDADFEVYGDEGQRLHDEQEELPEGNQDAGN